MLLAVEGDIGSLSEQIIYALISSNLVPPETLWRLEPLPALPAGVHHVGGVRLLQVGHLLAPARSHDAVAESK